MLPTCTPCLLERGACQRPLVPVEVAEVERQGRPDQDKCRDIRRRERLPIQLRGEQEVRGRREELEQRRHGER